MRTEDSRFVIPLHPELRPVPTDLLTADLPGADPRHARLFVAGWALSTAHDRDAHRAALQRAFDLYESRRPGLLDRPTRLTAQSIVAELEQLLGS